MNPTSRLYKEVEESTLQQLNAAAFPGTKILESQVLAGGMFNTTYRIVNTERTYVLLLGPVNRHLVLPFEERLMEGEQIATALLRKEGLPVPELLFLDVSGKQIDRDYMITAYVESIPLNHPSLQPEDKRKCYRDAGAYAKKIHTITGKAFGHVAQVEAGEGFATWQEFLCADLATTGARAVCAGAVEEETFHTIQRWFWEAGELFAEVERPALVHGDIWDGNILISGKDGALQVCALIDGDRALYGDPMFEFAGDWITDPCFEEGYGGFGQTEADRKRKVLYRLFLDLREAYILQEEYCQQEAAETARERLKQWMKFMQ